MAEAAQELAARAAAGSDVRIHQLDQPGDADRVRAIIDTVWGGQSPPPELLRAMQHAGSGLYGATANRELVGFVWGFAGLDGGLHLHSHMLGVIPEWEGRGVGYALKLAQRAACLRAGIDEVRWTYDPLVLRSARLNLVKLGAEAFGFLRNFYGSMQDRLNRGDRSDRFEVRWRLSSDRVGAALAGEPVPPEAGPALLERADTGTWPVPRGTASRPVPGCTVAIPLDYRAIREADPHIAATWRAEAAPRFTDCFDRGLVATWVTEDGRYVFESIAGG